jgi:ferric-dicitrate binding protein FerR (iron transport regulator)
MGEYNVTRTGQDLTVRLTVHEGSVDVEMLEVEGGATFPNASRKPFTAGESYAFTMRGSRGD